MRHRIWFDGPLAPSSTITIAGDEFHHAIRVVRARAGEEVEVFDGRGHAVAGVVAAIERDHAIVELQRELPSREARVRVHLAMAIIQLEKFELVLQKATELGAASFIPLETDRIELRRERYAGKMERWDRIVLEAVKQCGRAVIPRIESPIAFAEAVKRDGMKILFDADESEEPCDSSRESVMLFIGPEGGWSHDELALARSQGCAFRRLGPRRLRAETAGIVATAITAGLHDDNL